MLQVLLVPNAKRGPKNRNAELIHKLPTKCPCHEKKSEKEKGKKSPNVLNLGWPPGLNGNERFGNQSAKEPNADLSTKARISIQNPVHITA